MAGKKVVKLVNNLGDLEIAELENAIEYILFIDNQELFPMSEYTKLQPVIYDIAKMMIVYADVAARKVQDELTRKIALHLKEEVANVIYSAKKPTVERVIVEMTEPPVEVPEESSRYDW